MVLNIMLRRRGFTLIELLVVIAITSLLLGLLFPVFARAREKARQTVCASNLRQLGIAVFQYAADNNDTYPLGGDAGDIYTTGWVETPWAAVAAKLPLLTVTLAPYVKNALVWDCPDDTGYDGVGTGENRPLSAHPSGFAVFGMSYDYQTYLAFMQETLSGVKAWGEDPPYPECGPNNIILMSDVNGSWHGGKAYEYKRYNTLFCDGHVHYTTRDEESDLWGETFTPPHSP